MAELFELDDEFYDWYNGRPDVIKAMIDKTPINRLYRLKTTGQIVFIFSYKECGTVTVTVPAEYNFPHLTTYNVFGINPDDLEECELSDAKIEERFFKSLLEKDDTSNAFKKYRGLKRSQRRNKHGR